MQSRAVRAPVPRSSAARWRTTPGRLTRGERATHDREIWLESAFPCIRGRTRTPYSARSMTRPTSREEEGTRNVERLTKYSNGADPWPELVAPVGVGPKPSGCGRKGVPSESQGGRHGTSL